MQDINIAIEFHIIPYYIYIFNGFINQLITSYNWGSDLVLLRIETGDLYSAFLTFKHF